jgi:hypothetical protein
MMRIPILLFLAALVAIAPSSLHAQATAAPASENTTKFVGVWRGQFDNLPGVDLVITDEGGGLHGAILFYLHKRPDTKSPYSSTAGLPGPLLNIRADGQMLHFQVSHRLAHPPRTLHDPPISFRLKLTGPDQAELANESESAPGLLMKHSPY